MAFSPVSRIVSEPGSVLNSRSMERPCSDQPDAYARGSAGRCVPGGVCPIAVRSSPTRRAFDLITPLHCVTIFVRLVVWLSLQRVAMLMMRTATAISMFVPLSMVELMAVFISIRLLLGGLFLHV